jgi:hypothetical protein
MELQGATLAVVQGSMRGSRSGSRTRLSWDRCLRCIPSAPHCLEGGRSNWVSMATGVSNPSAKFCRFDYEAV